MVFGGDTAEYLQLNDETLYSGEPGDRDLPLNIAKDLAQVCRRLHAGEYAEVHEWVTKNWLGRAQNCYQPLGHLRLEFPSGDETKFYRRELDLTNAVVRVTYERSGVTFTREVFASHPAQAIIIRLRTSKPGALNFSATLDSPHRTATTSVWPGGRELHMRGQVPGFALRRDLRSVQAKGEAWKYPELFDGDGHPKAEIVSDAELSRDLFDGDGLVKPGRTPVLYGDAIGGRGMRFHTRLLVQTTDGQTAADAERLTVRDACEAVLILTSGSSFNGFDKSPSRDGKDEAAEAQMALARAARESFDGLWEEHINDYRALFGRVSLDLGPAGGRSAWPTPERLKHYAEGGDEPLAALYYHFGRYLLIAGSREGGQPLNLQGIWNPYIVPPWAGAYTLNINLEMNYWPVEISNLGECHEPLLRMIGELAVNGRKVARDMYGLPGWVAHHNTTIWRDAQPIDGDAGPAFWNMAGPWLCQHLWSHYLYTGDMAFLRERAYPLMQGAAEFMAAWLVDDGQGRLTTPVGTSPESRFLYTDSCGERKSASVIPGPTMDIALIRELFTNCARAAELLGIDENFRDELRAKAGRLRPYVVASRGQLEEWSHDFADGEPHSPPRFPPLRCFPGRPDHGSENTGTGSGGAPDAGPSRRSHHGLEPCVEDQSLVATRRRRPGAQMPRLSAVPGPQLPEFVRQLPTLPDRRQLRRRFRHHPDAHAHIPGRTGSVAARPAPRVAGRIVRGSAREGRLHGWLHVDEWPACECDDPVPGNSGLPRALPRGGRRMGAAARRGTPAGWRPHAETVAGSIHRDVAGALTVLSPRPTAGVDPRRRLAVKIFKRLIHEVSAHPCRIGVSRAVRESCGNPRCRRSRRS